MSEQSTRGVLASRGGRRVSGATVDRLAAEVAAGLGGGESDGQVGGDDLA